MRLHDIQVSLSSVDAANRYQVQNQQLAAAAQSQESINMMARDDIKKTQTQAMKAGQESQQIEEGRRGLKSWRKKDGMAKSKKEDDEERPAATGGHIIDIRA